MQALNNIGFSNFKAFKDYQSAELSSISLFFGYNNSGKSSILRAIKLLSDSFKINDTNQYMKSILDYTSQSIRGASHQELTHIKSSGILFLLGWGDDNSIKFKIKQNGLDPEIIEEIIVTLSGKVYHFLPSLKDGASSEIFELKDPEHNAELIIENLRLNCKEIDFSSINNLLDTFSSSVFHLNSTRAFPPREFEIGVGIPLEISPDGIGTAESIWYLSETNSPSFTDINEWLESISGRIIDTNNAPISIKNGKRTVRLETIPASASASTSELLNVSVLDSGEGIAQVLPVITLCAQAANNELGDFPIIVLEQPELHLHPDATVALAEFICSCAQKNKDARFIIETHSESFLLSIQKALVSKKLSNVDFSCNWVSKDSSSSKISKVIFDEDGYIVENWPDDVFGEIFQQTRDLIDARERNAVKPT
ncbi:MAG: AAA family ATPase [Colwellia sp.]|nr:AAA family ATPase [Colwellia sp.]